MLQSFTQSANGAALPNWLHNVKPAKPTEPKIITINDRLARFDAFARTVESLVNKGKKKAAREVMVDVQAEALRIRKMIGGAV